MSLRFGVNGLGRIGRALIRIAATRPELGLELAAANDSADPKQIARLLRHDTVHGTFPFEVASGEDSLVLAGRSVPLSRASTPQEIDWESAGVEVVLEATGKFRRRDLAAGHLAGVKRMLTGYANPGQPYLPRAMMEKDDEASDYDHLSRFREWSLSGSRS